MPKIPFAPWLMLFAALTAGFPAMAAEKPVAHATTVNHSDVFLKCVFHRTKACEDAAHARLQHGTVMRPFGEGLPLPWPFPWRVPDDQKKS
jgi:hypothetical protein